MFSMTKAHLLLARYIFEQTLTNVFMFNIAFQHVTDLFCGCVELCLGTITVHTPSSVEQQWSRQPWPGRVHSPLQTSDRRRSMPDRTSAPEWSPCCGREHKEHSVNKRDILVWVNDNQLCFFYNTLKFVDLIQQQVNQYFNLQYQCLTAEYKIHLVIRKTWYLVPEISTRVFIFVTNH